MEITPYIRAPAYGATPDGRVWRIAPTLNHRKVPYELKGCLAADGYLKMSLHTDEGFFQTYGHIVVAEVFHGPRPEGMEVAHGNGVRHDNRKDNLRWDTPAGNSADRWLHGTMHEGTKQWKAKLNEAAVREIRSGGSVAALSAKFGVCESNIRFVKRGETWRHV